MLKIIQKEPLRILAAETTGKETYFIIREWKPDGSSTLVSSGKVLRDAALSHEN